MASEDWFLRLDPYNFNSEKEYLKFYYTTSRKCKEGKNSVKNRKK